MRGIGNPPLSGTQPPSQSPSPMKNIPGKISPKPCSVTLQPISPGIPANYLIIYIINNNPMNTEPIKSRVLKFNLRETGYTTIRLSVTYYKILSIGLDGKSNLCIWIIVSDEPNTIGYIENIGIMTAYTGDTLEISDYDKYIGTCISISGKVIHAFHITKP